MAHVGLVVCGPAAPLAAEIALRDDVPFLSLTSGAHGLVAEVRAGSARDIDRTISELRALDNVVGVDTLTYVEVVRDVIGPVGEMRTEVDEVDLALLRALQDDGRASYVDLAAVVGLSPAGARRRVVRLVESQVVRIGAVVRHSGRDRQSAMGFGVRLAGDRRDVVEQLAALPSVIFVARTLGRFDVLVTVRAFSAAQLVELLDIVRALPGVNAVESWAHLEVVKERLVWALGFGLERASLEGGEDAQWVQVVAPLGYLAVLDDDDGDVSVAIGETGGDDRTLDEYSSTTVDVDGEWCARRS